MTAGPLVRLERDKALARITLARPEAGNALNPPLVKDLLSAAAQCANDPALRAILLTGEGRSFCVGGDIAEFERAGAHRQAVLSSLAQDLHAAEALFLGMRAPVVVAVQGAAAGAGLSLAMMADLVVAAASAHFTVAYTAIGLSADGGSTHILPRLIGMRRTQELMLTNRRLSAAEALDWGLVTAVVPDDELMHRAEAEAQRLAAGPTGAYAVIKTLLAQTYRTDFISQTNDEGREIARLAGLHDAGDGFAAFRAKRPPVFKGND